jgi:hypothetical protein
MKKLLIATGISFVVLSGCAYAQQSGNALASAHVKSVRPKNEFMNDINVRAMRDFMDRYGDASDVVWHRSKDNYVAVFTRDSIQHRVIYTNRGDPSITMKYYEEKKLARNVRAQIKSIYFDYKIYIVQEIESVGYPTIYIVNLQGDSDWKKVKLYQGEMEVMEEYNKRR